MALSNEKFKGTQFSSVGNTGISYFYEKKKIKQYSAMHIRLILLKKYIYIYMLVYVQQLLRKTSLRTSGKNKILISIYY